MRRVYGRYDHSLLPPADRTYYRTPRNDSLDDASRQRPTLADVETGGTHQPPMAYTTPAHPGTPHVDIDERVRYLRREMGLTEGDLAAITGAADRTVRRWLAGTTPQARHAERLDDLHAIV